MVDRDFGIEMQDALLLECDLPSGGIYTAVGTYDHSEIAALVSKLSEKTGISVRDLLRVFGEHLFSSFATRYPAFFDGEGSAFEFLENVESYIHVEVLKLYPSAELPRFEVERPDQETLVMIYHSDRHLEELAHGLICGCLKHFQEVADIRQSPRKEADGSVRFEIKRGTGGRPEETITDGHT